MVLFISVWFDLMIYLINYLLYLIFFVTFDVRCLFVYAYFLTVHYLVDSFYWFEIEARILIDHEHAHHI